MIPTQSSADTKTEASSRSECGALPTFWRFPDDSPILIICGELQPEDRPRFASTSNNNYMQLSAYADLDSLIELFGHIRAQNPNSNVRFESARRLDSDDVQSHLVILGGIGLNAVTRSFSNLTDLPVLQVEDVIPGDDTFVLTENPERRFHASFVNGILVEDVGLLFRTSNPANVSRTLTMCNGIYTRGVYGAVRCLTDAAVSTDNYEYLTYRFGDSSNFGLLMKVQVIDQATPSPDLTNPATVLYEWPPE